MSVLTKLTPKLHVREHENEKWYMFWCPACKRCHIGQTPRWGFNDNIESPTFTPSILMTAEPSNYRCHINITDGKIIYHSDCNHALRGQTIDMMDIPEDYST